MARRDTMERGWGQETGEATNRRLSPEVLERTLLTMDNFVLLTDPRLDDNPIVWVNDAFCAFTGYERGEVLGRNCRFLQGDDRDQPARHRLRAAIVAGEACDVVLRNYKKDGTLFHNYLCVSPVMEDGEVCYFVGLQHDVSERESALRDLRERELHEAMERERERFGMDLHDGLGQELAGAAFLAQVLRQRLEAEGSPYAADAKHLLDSLTSAQGSAWNLARGLNPVDPSPHGLGDALHRLCHQVTETHAKIEGHCDVEPIEFAQRREARYLYRIAQEAVNNAAKHAQASEIAISLRRLPDAVRLEVSDDGVGIPAAVLEADHTVAEQGRNGEASAERSGMGLYGMRFRAELIGARLAIRPRDTGGTVVQCVLPSGPRPSREGVDGKMGVREADQL